MKLYCIAVIYVSSLKFSFHYRLYISFCIAFFIIFVMYCYISASVVVHWIKNTIICSRIEWLVYFTVDSFYFILLLFFIMYLFITMFCFIWMSFFKLMNWNHSYELKVSFKTMTFKVLCFWRVLLLNSIFFVCIFVDLVITKKKNGKWDISSYDSLWMSINKMTKHKLNFHSL